MTKDKSKSILAEILKRLRERRGWTLQDIADKSDLHRTYIGFLEKGEKNPTISAALKIADAYDVDLSLIIKLLQKESTISDDSIALLSRRLLDISCFQNEEYFYNNTGLEITTLKNSIEEVYSTLDSIDVQLNFEGLEKLKGLVELANLSSMLGNLLGAEIESNSNGAYIRNKPHTYPDLLSKGSRGNDIEIKVALEKNRPKGHLPKPGHYLTFRYVLGSHEKMFDQKSRGDCIWIWEIKYGVLTKNDFNISNTEGDSGKTANISGDAFNKKMKLIFFDEQLCPYSKNPQY